MPGPDHRVLAGDAIVRLILDGTVVKVRIDRQATALSILVAMGVRQDGQKMVLAIRTMGGESQAAWRVVLDDLVARGMTAPGLVIVDRAPGLEAALAALWPEIPVQRCTVHKERNLLAHAPKKLHDEIKADYTAMMYADTAYQRYLYYHTAEDTPDKVNFPRLAEATAGLYRCCAAMAEEGLDALG